ncbi:hypothetical protein Acr_21g0011320 [Actinidia rufa]|uniref:Retrotransposon gag domain-containing protein n=1 Tax=Actinidia rufa TaxID=165716 RepID=A0A7J0GI96_9ERIC|nr:hypothetical protein Acr_21g0011320 [Actinidia rufa]
MEPRQVISTELARATIGVFISSPRARVPAPPRPWASGLAPALYFCSSVQVALQASAAQYRGDKASLIIGCSPRFLPQQFGAVCGNDSSRSSMHLRSRNLPRPSASSPPGNRSHPMANPGQAPDLEGLHREIHDMAEQMRIMNENNGRLMQLLAAANPPLPAAPPEGGDAKYQARPYVKRVPQNLVKLQPGREGEGVLTEATISGHEISPPHKKIQDLDARLDTINTGTNAPVIVDTLIRQTEPPFTWRILRARISLKFKLPTQLGIYEGKTDPMDHLDSTCQIRSWFRKLSPGTIDSFGDLSRLFVANFMSCKNRQKNASHLFTVHQKETESLKDFVKRFNQAILEVEDPSDKVIIMAMMEGLRPSPLFDSFSKSVPETLSALQSKADKYVAAKELAEAKRRRRGKDDHKRKQPDTRRDDYKKETRYKRPDRDPKRSNNRRPRTPPRRPEFILPPLNAPVAQVLSEIKHEEFVKWPEKIKTDPQKRNRNKYCEFHRDHGHNTEDYFQLKEQIADLIKRGYLSKYVADRPPPNSPERRRNQGRSKSSQTVLHFGHEGRDLFKSVCPIAITGRRRRHRGTERRSGATYPGRPQRNQ